MIAILCTLLLSMSAPTLPPAHQTAQFYGVSIKGEFIYKLSDGSFRVGPKLPFYSAPQYAPQTCPSGKCPLQPSQYRR